MSKPAVTKFGKVTNFPGLYHIGKQLSDHFPEDFKEYCEPFCGKARTAHYAKEVCGESNVFLSGLSDYEVKYCKDTFPEAKVKKADFREVLEDCRKRPNMFVLIDPPWYKFPAYEITNTITEYYRDVIRIMDQEDTVCKWMLVGSTKKPPSSKMLDEVSTRFPNTVIYNDHGACMNGGKIGVRFIKNY